MISFLATEQYHKILFGIGLIISIILLMGRFSTTNSIAGGDAVYYYMNVRSLVIDHDIDFKNEYAHFYNEVSPFTGYRKILSIPDENLATGRLPNKYPIGTAIFLAPFFALAHVLALLLQKLGFSVQPDGYGSLYQLSAGFGSLLYAFAGIILIYHLGRKLYNPAVAFAGASAIWLATPLIYYMTMEPLMSHTISMFGITLFVFLWYVTREDRKMYQWSILGLVGGLLVTIRYQDALFTLIPFIDTLYLLLKRRAPSHQPWFRSLLGLLIFTLSSILAATPQFYSNIILNGSLIPGYSQQGEDFCYWNSPKLLYTLFSAQSGLILWSPIIFFSFIGLYFLLKKNMSLGLLLSFSFAIQWYLVSSWWSIDQGHTFGNRMLLNSVVVFAVGLMQFLDKLQENVKLFKYAISLCIVFILTNGILAGLYCFRIIGHPYSTAPVSFHP